MGTPTYSYVSIVIITKATDEDSIIYETSVMKMFMVPLLLKLVKVRFVSFSKTKTFLNLFQGSQSYRGIPNQYKILLLLLRITRTGLFTKTCVKS